MTVLSVLTLEDVVREAERKMKEPFRLVEGSTAIYESSSERRLFYYVLGERRQGEHGVIRFEIQPVREKLPRARPFKIDFELAGFTATEVVSAMRGAALCYASML